MPDGPGDGRAPSGDVRVDHDGAVTTLVVSGHLDLCLGARLLDAARATAPASARVDIDLREVKSFTPDGAAALGTCRQVGAGLDQGLHFRTGRGPGMAALLEGCGAGGTESSAS